MVGTKGRRAVTLLYRGSAHWWESLRLGTPGHLPVPELWGTLAPAGHRRLLLSASGPRWPASRWQGVTPNKLPAEHGIAQTQTLLTGGLTPRGSQSSAFPPRTARTAGQTGQRPGQLGPTPSLQAGRTPCSPELRPVPLKGRGTAPRLLTGVSGHLPGEALAILAAAQCCLFRSPGRDLNPGWGRSPQQKAAAFWGCSAPLAEGFLNRPP